MCLPFGIGAKDDGILISLACKSASSVIKSITVSPKQALHNTHLVIPPFDEIFPLFTLFIHPWDNVYCFGVQRTMFLIYGCFEPLVCLLEKNLV